MQIIKNLKVPTGNICIGVGEKAKPLEFLSIGDYGKEINLNSNKEVPNGLPILPLTEKWVITISTQYGCSMNCSFCDVPKVGAGINATYADIKEQIVQGLILHPEIHSTKRLNVHYARMGEPTWNTSVLGFTKNIRKELYPYIGRSLIHPVISTMLPKANTNLNEYLNTWMDIKNDLFRGDAGLQLSINSTDNAERNLMFSDNALSIEQVSEIGKMLDMPKGRKITLNFALAGYTIDEIKLRDLFDPMKFICKITPMHKTKTALEKNIKTNGEYTTPEPYQETEAKLKAVGFDVLTFIASEDEDLGRITCGNAILSGTLPHKYIYV